MAGLLARDLEVPGLVSYWGDTSVLVLVAAVCGAAVWATPLRRWLGAGVVALCVLWCVVQATPLAEWLGRGLIRRDPLTRADAVCVLSSRMQEDGEPTAVALTRLLHGVELIAEGFAPRLILSELPEPQAPYAPYARRLLDNLGIETEVIALGPVSRTRDEAVAVADLFRRRGFRRLILVTSPVHSVRGSLCFEHEGIEVVSSPALETRFDWERLERPSERLPAFGAVLHERVGLVYYRVRGWLGPAEPNGR